MIYPFLPAFGRGLGVDLYTLSLAVTLRSSSGILGPLLASIADNRGRKAGMLTGLCLFIVGTGLMTVWHSFPAFVLSLVLCLLANLTFLPSMQAYLGDRVPYQRRGLVLALTEFSWSLSFIIGVPLVGLSITRNGWQAPYPWLAGLGLMALILLANLLPKDAPANPGRPSLWRNLRTVFAYPPALAGLLFSIMLSGSNEMVNLVFGVWLEDTLQVKLTALAAASAIIGFSELGGETLVSILVDRLGKRRAVGIGLILNVLAVLALPALGSSLFGALVGLSLLYLSFEFTLVSSIPMMSEILPSARATFMATFIASIALGRAIGDLLAPSLYQAGEVSGAPPGIQMVVLGAVALDLVALVALRAVRISQVEHQTTQAD